MPPVMLLEANMVDAAILSVLMTAAATAPGASDVAQRFERWESGLRSRVESLHMVPAGAQQVSPCDVTVGFGVNCSGTATDARILESSCSRFFERKAVSLVQQLGRVGPVPSLDGRDRRVSLKLTYGSRPDATADRELDNELEEERATFARRNLATVAAGLDQPPSSGWKAGDR